MAKKPATKKKAATKKTPETAPAERNLYGKEIIKVTTQAALDAALARDVEIWLCGAGQFLLSGPARHYSVKVVARESSHVVAWESSHVVARGSSHVEARGSSHVVAWESSHVEAWESSHVEAAGAASLSMFGASKATATRQVVVQRHSTLSVVDGGIVIDIQAPRTAAEWCDWYGVKVVDGIATVYKGVRDNYQSVRGGDYTPGTTPVAHDWDGGTRECGLGLHFSPTAAATKRFDDAATKFLACQVKLEDMRAPREGDEYQEKIKARGCCGPCVEVDLWGKPVQAVAA